MSAYLFRRGAVKHTLACVARFIRLVLGIESVAKEKLEYGPTLVILGLQVEINTEGFSFRPADEKATCQTTHNLPLSYVYAPCDTGQKMELNHQRCHRN